MNNTLRVISVLGLLSFVTACQTTGEYPLNSQMSIPGKNEFSDSNEYLVRLAMYGLPKRCVVVKHAGDINDPISMTKALGTFNLLSITQNATEGEGNWYAVRSAINHLNGDYYMNSDFPNQFACGYPNFQRRFMETGKVNWQRGKVILNAEQIKALVPAPKPEGGA